jgi:hypothetical protein
MQLKHQMGTQMACWWCFFDKMTLHIVNQGKHVKCHNKAQGNTRHDARDNALHGAPGNTRHSVQQGKDGCKAACNSKDENRVFHPDGNPRLAEFTSMAEAGKAALCPSFLLPSNMRFAQDSPTQMCANN